MRLPVILRTRKLWALLDEHGNIIEADPTRWNLEAANLAGERIVRVDVALPRNKRRTVRRHAHGEDQ